MARALLGDDAAGARPGGGGRRSCKAGFIDVSVTAADVERITETTLALLLFADAATLDLGEVRKDTAAGAAPADRPAPDRAPGRRGGWLVSRGRTRLRALIGAILAPTDAALGLPIFTNRRVPVRIRRALNIESGLNDGIATPLVTLFLALALEEQQAAQGWLLGALSGIGWGLLIGVVGGLAGGFGAAVAHRWTTATAQRVGNLVLALGVYGAALAVGRQRLHRRVRRRPRSEP